MSYRLKLDEFEGPLELLLSLIEEEKLDITKISLARVTDQYLAYIDRENRLPTSEVADFLVVAAKLIYIKSKLLLPAIDLDEEEGDLAEQLKIYREYYEASKAIAKMVVGRNFMYPRVTPFRLPREAGFSPPPNVKLSDLPSILRGVIARLDAILSLPKAVLKRTVSIREKIAMLRDALTRGISRFHQLYDKSNKQDIIVSFLALLELVKMRHVHVSQEELFAEIHIHRHASPNQ